MGERRDHRNTRTPTVSSSAEDVTLPPVIRKAIFIAPELLDSMAMANDFTDDPLMADICKRFMFWQENTRVFHEGYNTEIISDCVFAAVSRILAKYPDSEVGRHPTSSVATFVTHSCTILVTSRGNTPRNPFAHVAK
ncbi:hypothetical protein K466DRAFT_270104 [Polyporus arcularius HHB13444]|uniref:Uncharacterized protein n=1 Tax=Polyporus arcularius HHB13444 TaxID=1314778 RepID=A0A5C3PS55_9APHY|nr:hypothetical protein K466DRAFT_270104 [Polyporus arcularius HHB13444]